MKVRTIAITLTLLVAGLAIGCSSAPVPEFSEQEAIAIARSYQKHLDSQRNSLVGRNICFATERANTVDYVYTDFRHTESASFKANGLWLGTTKTSYYAERRDKSLPADFGSHEFDCLYLVDDSTGKVRPN